MATGLLEVSGTLDATQFWPNGTSDADTIKITVAAGASAFRFRAHPGASSRPTRAFRGAVVLGRVRKPAVDAKGQVVVRLQGVDAPELHYRPEAAVAAKDRTSAQASAWDRAKGDLRQPLGETAARELGKLFTKVAGGNSVPCVLRTAVDTPGDAFDTYGRLVADVVFMKGPREVNLNLWLAKNGWAVPSFYASMSAEEIEACADAAVKAKEQRRGLWPRYKSSAALFERVAYRTVKAAAAEGVDAVPDVGNVVMPKVFRRLSTWATNKAGRLVGGTFKAYLEKAKDGCYLTGDFLEQGVAAATHRRLDEFVAADGRIAVGAAGLVFQEKPSRVVAEHGREAEW